MTVIEGWFAGKHYGESVPDLMDLPEAVKEHLALNIAMNSKVLSWQSRAACLHFFREAHLTGSKE